MKKLLTVSVAAFNVEQYIAQCIESMIIPDIMDCLEVFIIIDGATDNTADVAKKYERQYPNTFHVIEKQNGGYGSTVNYSIKNATGKYFKLLDGDDWFEKSNFRKMLESLKSADEDVVFSHFFLGQDSDNLKILKRHNHNTDDTCEIRDFKPKMPIGMWCITYKTDILRESEIALPEHSLYTDQIFITVPFSIAKTARFLDFPVYCYRVGRDGQSMSKESRIKHLDELISVCEIVYDFCDGVTQNENIDYIMGRVSRCHALIVETILLLPRSKESKSRLIQCEANLKEMHPQIYRYAVKCQKVGKLICLFRLTHYCLYWPIKMIYYK